jgi:hypothetical protein
MKGPTCLALNSSYEPATDTRLRRAVRQVLDGNAVAVEPGSGMTKRDVLFGRASHRRNTPCLSIRPLAAAESVRSLVRRARVT